MLQFEISQLQAQTSEKTQESLQNKSQSLTIEQQSENNNKLQSYQIKNECLSDTQARRSFSQEQFQQHSQYEDVTIKKGNKTKQTEFLDINLEFSQQDNSKIQQNLNNSLQNYIAEDIQNEIAEEKSEKNNEKDNKYKQIDKIFEKVKQQQEIKSWKYTVYEELLKKEYIIEDYINSGGQACVFSGYQLDYGQKKYPCAFKIYFEVKSEEFKKEIEIMKSFEEPINIIRVLDSFEIGDQYVLILEKCQHSLLDELKQIKELDLEFSTEQLLNIIFDLMDGLIQFRVYNILHLDIKPGNILVRNDGNYCYTDFGASFNKKENQEIKIECFTKKYASPEQLNYETSIDFQSDVYSLGKTLKVVLDVFKKQNLEYKNNQKDIIDTVKDLEKIIYDNMIKDQISERLQCQKIHQLLFQRTIFYIKQTSMNELRTNYFRKTSDIIGLNPYKKNKDIPYIQDMILYYNQIQLYLTHIDDEINRIHETFVKLDKQNETNKKNNGVFDFLEISQEEFQYYINKYKNPYDLLGDYLYQKQIVKCLQLKTMSNSYYELGNFKGCLKCNLQCLELRKQMNQINNIVIAQSNIDPQQLKNLARDYNHDLAKSLSAVGQNYDLLGDHEIALDYLLEALEIRLSIPLAYKQDLSESFENAGVCYMHLGKHQTGLSYLLQSLEIRKLFYRGFHSSIAQSLREIGIGYFQLRDFQKSLRFLFESYLIYKETRTGNNPNVADILDRLGQCYVSLGKKKTGLKYLLKSLQMKKVIQGDCFDTADILQDIGSLYIQRDDYESGHKYLLECLEMKRKIFHKDHPEIQFSQNILKVCEMKMNDYQNIQKCKETLKMHQKKHNEIDKPLSTENEEMEKQNLQKKLDIIKYFRLVSTGDEYIKKDDFKNGLKYSLESLQMSKQIFEKEWHISSSQPLSIAGQCYLLLGDFQNSLKFYKEALEVDKLNDSGHKNICIILNNIGCCYINLGNSKIGLNYLLESLVIRKQIFKGNYPIIHIQLYKIQVCYQSLGFKKQFFKYYAKQVEMEKQIGNPDFYQNLKNLVESLMKEGDFKNGLKYSLELVQVNKQKYKGNHPSIASTLNYVGVCYMYLKEDKNQSVKYFLESVEMSKQIYQGNHDSTASNLALLGSSYMKMGENQLGIQYQFESLDMLKAIHKGNHPHIVAGLYTLGESYFHIGDQKNGQKYLQESQIMARNISPGSLKNSFYLI